MYYLEHNFDSTRKVQSGLKLYLAGAAAMRDFKECDFLSWTGRPQRKVKMAAEIMQDDRKPAVRYLIPKLSCGLLMQIPRSQGYANLKTYLHPLTNTLL